MLQRLCRMIRRTSHTHTSNRDLNQPLFFCKSQYRHYTTGNKNDDNNDNKQTSSPPLKKDDDEPHQPLPPTNCCGSGCANCVWDVYFEEMDEYNKKLKISDPNAPLEPLLTTGDEDPMQFFMKMERYNALQRKKAELKQQQEEEGKKESKDK
ncbi:hypothetical protein CYY_000145 [Polysphondylium violaceum]|uniref:Oxidoreductase-like domain-containing protein n=1 Tax=Polysphondylium violaceum TaxID=133409 RepID=A0A8J4Q4B5_9MYCE|nr:hypothetical protein CYY_000145 [Polysphondylium violaceum]